MDSLVQTQIRPKHKTGSSTQPGRTLSLCREKPHTQGLPQRPDKQYQEADGC